MFLLYVFYKALKGLKGLIKDLLERFLDNGALSWGLRPYGPYKALKGLIRLLRAL